MTVEMELRCRWRDEGEVLCWEDRSRQPVRVILQLVSSAQNWSLTGIHGRHVLTFFSGERLTRPSMTEHWSGQGQLSASFLDWPAQDCSASV